MALLNDPKEKQPPCQTKPVDFHGPDPGIRVSDSPTRHHGMTGVVFKRQGAMPVAMALPV